MTVEVCGCGSIYTGEVALVNSGEGGAPIGSCGTVRPMLVRSVKAQDWRELSPDVGTVQLRTGSTRGRVFHRRFFTGID